jgi:hypothetical protein
LNVNEALRGACDVSYPISSQELSESVSGQVEAPDGSTFEVSELIGLEGCPQKFESQDDLWMYLYSVLPEGAVGRVGYDDRGYQEESNPQSF